MDGEELATPSRSDTPSHVETVTRKEKREWAAEEKKEHNFCQRQNKQKRLKTAEKAVPVLSAGVRVAEEQNTVLNAALQERDFASICLRGAWRKKGESAPLLSRHGVRRSRRSGTPNPICWSRRHGPLL